MRENSVQAMPRRGLIRLLVLLASAAVASVPSAAQGGPGPELSEMEQAALEGIRASEIMPTIRFLASARLEGRESGERGSDVAADYLVSRFQASGLEAGTKQGFLQRFDLRYRVLGAEASFTLESRSEQATRRREWEPRRDYFPLSFSEQGEAEAPVVFAGYGIEAPEYDWDDYAVLGRDGARDKIVLVFRHEPDEEGETHADRFEGREMSLHASLRQKVRVAAAHGAVGMILVDDPLLHDVEENPSSSLSRWRMLTEEERALPADDPVRFRGRPDTRDSDKPLGIVAVHASQEILRWIDPQRDWKALQTSMDEEWKPRTLSFPGIRARIVHQSEEAYRSTSNVIGVVRGSDPERSDEYVLVGGHYDHVGMDEEGSIYNGADDNASGTAVVVALAGAFAGMPKPPARSLIFALWGAEEEGLLGSDWFVHHPPVELGEIVAAINLDMIGRNDEKRMSVVGRAETPDLVELFDRFAATVELTLNDDAGAGASRSDNASLWLAGIPTASLFSGLHDDYHEPSDTADKIVPGKVERAARLAFLVMNAVANAETPPEPLRVPSGPWDPVAPEARRTSGEASGDKP